MALHTVSKRRPTVALPSTAAPVCRCAFAGFVNTSAVAAGYFGAEKHPGTIHIRTGVFAYLVMHAMVSVISLKPASSPPRRATA